MTKVQELEVAIAALPPKEYQQFRRWFIEVDSKRWDAQILADAEAGNLDFLVAEAAEAKKSKHIKPLCEYRH